MMEPTFASRVSRSQKLGQADSSVLPSSLRVHRLTGLQVQLVRCNYRTRLSPPVPLVKQRRSV